ncbi:MAG: DUF2723 domain-containing protein [Bacteroidota bacterium]
MTERLGHRILAGGVFLASTVVYLLTMAPTVVFWDVGEFIAAADMLQVPHPPGSPLFLLLTRLAIMLPVAADHAVRAHALTAVCSGLAAMFVYLVTVRVIRHYRERPRTPVERIALYGSAAVGALSLAFGTTVWNNSIESEVYGLSTLFLAAIMWLVMRWLEREEQGGNEKYILLISYLVGLSLGVHLLALLAIFPVLMIIYFKRYTVNLNSFFLFGMVTVGIFAVVYPGIVKYLPGMMDGDWRGTRSDLIAVIPWILIALVFYGVYATHQRRRKMAHIGLLSLALIFIGYTTYLTVLIRSNAEPPMNENNPSNLAGLTYYLGREQYGDSPLWPRRYSQEPQHQGIYTNYSSEMDFLIRYQLNHMFTRYLLWNYAGSEGDWQDARANLFPLNALLNPVAKALSGTTPFAGSAWDSLFCLPLAVGLFGLWQHFKRDRTMALVFLTMFLLMGPVLALFQGQQEPQPRERDYFYVGALLVFSIWVAIGLLSLVDLAGRAGSASGRPALLVAGILGAGTLAIPVNMLRVNWESHNRSGNYVAWDYSYNILQTCEKDAILFTNGDNDTFPLWYLQDVEGVRRDVRIVNLSLVNTPWYIQQMKAPPYYPEAKPVPMSLSDAQIARIQPMAWEPRQLTLPVPQAAFDRYGATDSAARAQGAVTFTMNHTFMAGTVKAVKVQDIMVRDIIFANNWERPVYFAVTVSPDSKIGLDEYLWFHGLAWRLEPRRTAGQEQNLDPEVVRRNLFDEPEGFAKEHRYGYRFRGVADPAVYFDENTTKLMINYRSAFIRLALYYANMLRDNARAQECLDRMETLIPRRKIPMGWELSSDIASFYQRIGRKETYLAMQAEIEPVLQDLIASGQYNVNSYYNPFRVLLDLYEVRDEPEKALEVMQRLAERFPNDRNLQQRIQALEQEIRARNPASAKSDTAS